MTRLLRALVAVSMIGVASTARADDRPFVWTFDPAGPVDEEVEALYVLNTLASSSTAVRLIDIGRVGVVQQLGAQAALSRYLLVGAYGLVSLGNPTDAPVSGTAGGYLQITAVRPEPGSDGVSFALMVSGLREFPGEYQDVFSLSGWVELGYAVGPVALAANVQVEHRFVPTADPVDLFARAGATVAVIPELRLGLEYVVQDVEGYLYADEDDEAEGGALHLIAGAIVGNFEHEGLSFGVSPGVAVSSTAVGFGARLFLSWRFYGW